MASNITSAMKSVAAKKHEAFMDRLAAKLGPKMAGHVHFIRNGEDSPVVKAFNEIMEKQRRRKVN